MNKLIDKVLNMFNFISLRWINEKNVLYEIINTFEHQLNLIHKRIIIDIYYLVNKDNKIQFYLQIKLGI